MNQQKQNYKIFYDTIDVRAPISTKKAVIMTAFFVERKMYRGTLIILKGAPPPVTPADPHRSRPSVFA